MKRAATLKRIAAIAARRRPAVEQQRQPIDWSKVPFDARVKLLEAIERFQQQHPDREYRIQDLGLDVETLRALKLAFPDPHDESTP